MKNEPNPSNPETDASLDSAAKKGDRKTTERCLDNIYYLAKKLDVKIKDLEGNAGVRQGYLSRYKKRPDTLPQAEVLFSIAEQLGVTADLLVRCRVSKLGPDDQLANAFIDDLNRKTVQREILWRAEDLTPRATLDEPHLFFQLGEIRFCSSFDPEAVPDEDPSYSADLGNGVTAFLVSVTAEPGSRHEAYGEVELYLKDPSAFRPICATSSMKEKLSGKLYGIYNLAEHFSKGRHLTLDEDTRVLLRKVMGQN